MFKDILQTLIGKKPIISPVIDSRLSVPRSNVYKVQEPLTDTQKLWKQYGRPAENPYGDILREVFGDRANDMNEVLRWGTPDNKGHGINYGGENLDFDPKAENHSNKNGSIDRGLFMINSNTFKDYLTKHNAEMQQRGIQNYDQMFDPKLNAMMADLIQQNQGYGAWYGASPRLLK